MRSTGHPGVSSRQPAAWPSWRSRCRMATAFAAATALATTWLGGAAGAAAIPAAASATVPCRTQRLDQAIANAPANATLGLTAGCTYRLSAALPTIDRNLTIDGNGATITRSSGTFTMVTVQTARLALNRITISRAESPSGPVEAPGALLATGGASVTITGSAFDNNHGQDAGAIEATNFSLVSITRSTFADNQSPHGAGAIEIFAASRLIIAATRSPATMAALRGASLPSASAAWR